MSSSEATSITDLYQISPADLERVRQFGKLVVPKRATALLRSTPMRSSQLTATDRWNPRSR
jgi:hypothetical protein